MKKILNNLDSDKIQELIDMRTNFTLADLITVVFDTEPAHSTYHSENVLTTTWKIDFDNICLSLEASDLRLTDTFNYSLILTMYHILSPYYRSRFEITDSIDAHGQNEPIPTLTFLNDEKLERVAYNLDYLIRLGELGVFSAARAATLKGRLDKVIEDVLKREVIKNDSKSTNYKGNQNVF